MEFDLEAAVFDKGHEPDCIWSYVRSDSEYLTTLAQVP